MILRPTFSHPVFEQLYSRDYFIDDAVLREILALGPETAVPELLKITDIALDNFRLEEASEVDWSENFYFLHALYLLHELHAPEALDVHRRLLRHDLPATEYWFGDELSEELPALLARASQTRLPELLAMLEDQDMLLKNRLTASEAISRLAREQQELRPAISAFLQQHLRHVIAQGDQVAQLFPSDSGTYAFSFDDYLGILLANLQDAGLRELEPEVRELHRLGVIHENIAGGEADIDFDREFPLRRSPDIFARYQEERENPDNYSPFHPNAAALLVRHKLEEARYARAQRDILLKRAGLVLPKIGRNDPCPCGSGKKYKKCCGA